MTNKYSEIFNFWYFKVAFLGFKEEFIGLEDIQHFSYDTAVLFDSICEDQDVIYVDNYVSFVYKFFKDVIHKPLERGQWVG